MSLELVRSSKFLVAMFKCTHMRSFSSVGPDMAHFMLQAEEGFVTEITFVWSVFIVHHFDRVIKKKGKGEYNYLGKKVLYTKPIYTISQIRREKNCKTGNRREMFDYEIFPSVCQGSVSHNMIIRCGKIIFRSFLCLFLNLSVFSLTR